MLLLAATPIGNLGDASRRLVEALETREVIAAEDTRTTVQLLRGLGIENRPRLIALHEHNERDKAAELVELAREGDLLLMSDAGMPTVSDPGFVLVQAAIAGGRAGLGAPRPERGADGARGQRPADRPVRVRGVPPAQGPAARAARARGRDRAPSSSSSRRTASPTRCATSPRRSARTGPRRSAAS